MTRLGATQFRDTQLPHNTRHAHCQGVPRPHAGAPRSLRVLDTRRVQPGPLPRASSDRPLWSRTLTEAATRDLPEHIQFSERYEEPQPSAQPKVKVRLQVHYRVHSRQILCVAGSVIPFGWSFMSIAKVPMSWGPADVWSVEVELPPGVCLDYKYVILEEQDWTQQVNEAVEGRVAMTYRHEPAKDPPDVQHITKQMAIVAWQPGPNRRLFVPHLDEFSGLNPGNRVSRRAHRPTRNGAPPPGAARQQRTYGQRAVGRAREGEVGASPPPFLMGGSGDMQPRQEELEGVWELLCVESDGVPLLERRDVWGREHLPPASHQPPENPPLE